MTIFLLYLLESSLCLTILLGVYFLFFRRETYFHFNRIYLLGLMIFSLLIPIVHVSISSERIEVLESSVSEIQQIKSYYSRLIAMTDPEFDFSDRQSSYFEAFEDFSSKHQLNKSSSSTIQSGGEEAQNLVFTSDHDRKSKFPWIQFILWIYLTGIALFFFRLVSLIIWLMKTKKNNSCIRMGRFIIVQLEEEMPPFSFFRYVFVNKEVYDRGDFEKIITHEITHIRQMHSFDLILAQSLSILQWFNPFAWQLQKAIKTNHEYLADEQVINQGFELFDYQSLLLTQLISIRSVELVNNFNLLSIQKRIAMMKKVKSGFTAKLKVLLIIPFAVALFLFFADMTFYGSGKSISNFINLKSTNEIAKFQGIWENVDEDTYGRLLAFDATSISLLDDAFYLYEYKATMSRQAISMKIGADNKLDITYQLKGNDLYIWWNDEKPSCYRKIKQSNSLASMVGELAAEVDLPSIENYHFIDWAECFNLVFDGEELMVGDQEGKLSELDAMLKAQKGRLNKLTMNRMTVKLFIDKDVDMGKVTTITNALRRNGLLKVAYMGQPADGGVNVLLAHTYGRTRMLPPLEGVVLMTNEEIRKQRIELYEINTENKNITTQSIRPDLKKFIKESEKYLATLYYENDTKYSLFLAYYDAMLVVLSELRNDYAWQNYQTDYNSISEAQQKEVRKAYPAIFMVKGPEDK